MKWKLLEKALMAAFCVVQERWRGGVNVTCPWHRGRGVRFRQSDLQADSSKIFLGLKAKQGNKMMKKRLTFRITRVILPDRNAIQTDLFKSERQAASPASNYLLAYTLERTTRKATRFEPYSSLPRLHSTTAESMPARVS